MLKPGSGYAELTAGARGAGGTVTSFLRGELGARLTPGVSLFGYGEGTLGTSLQPGWQAGLGARVTW